MTSLQVMVWDTTGPAYALACGQLGWLFEAAGPACRHVLPSIVVEEMAELGVSLDDSTASLCEIFDCNALDSLEDVVALARWMEILGTDLVEGHNAGEAFVALIASRETGSAAIVDDRKAVEAINNEVARAETAESRLAHGVLWAISRGVIEGRASTPSAYSGLCDAMLRADQGRLGVLRWPIQVGEYPSWFEQNRKRLSS